MKTILASAYAVNPYKGSEDAMGWNYIYQISRFHKVVAVTRENNREQIERYMSEHPNELYSNISFLYYDLPYHLRFWKRGSRGSMLYFYLWQKGIVDFVRKQNVQFDIVHNLNFHNDWIPSFLWQLEKPFVWGPIGHHPYIPSIFNVSISLKDRFKNKLSWTIKNYFWKYSKVLKNTIDNATYIWSMNDSVSEVLNLNHKTGHISPSVATNDYGYYEKSENECFEVLSAGRLVSMKGFDLTIRSFAAFIANNPNANTKLTIVGDGPEKQSLHILIKELRIEAYVTIINWIDRDKLLLLMKASSVFLFPSHEGAGMVVPEALSFGLPVITIDNCGPGQFIDDKYGIVVSADSYEYTVNGLANGLTTLYQNKDLYQSMRSMARKAFEEKFHWDRRGEKLKEIYSTI